jgi:hypothetical protein
MRRRRDEMLRTKRKFLHIFAAAQLPLAATNHGVMALC